MKLKYAYRYITGLVSRCFRSNRNDADAIAVVIDAARIALRKAVNPSANFFDQGGDSLAAMEFMAEVQRRTEVEVPFTVLITDSVQEVAVIVKQKCNSRNA